MNEKFTPGPWNDVHDCDDVIILDQRGFEIAEAPSIAILHQYQQKFGVDHWAHKPGQSFITLSRSEQAANALLIAASPALYAAAKQALLECSELMGTPAGDALDAALKQARGEV
jgi:hypothetical protein